MLFLLSSTFLSFLSLLSLFSLFISTSYSTQYLRGTTYRVNQSMVNKSIVIFNKINVICIFYTSFHCMMWQCNLLHSYINCLFALYTLSYIQTHEYTGKKKLKLDSFILRNIFKLFKLFGEYHVINDYINDDNNINNEEIYMMGIHPHGIWPSGTIGCLGLPSNIESIDKIIPIINTKNIYIGIASFCFYIPGLREIFLFMGAVDCSRPILERFLKNKKSFAIFMGGAEEAIYSGLGKTDLIIYKRSGFFQLAIEYGATIIPIYTFGNNNIYESQTNDIFGILNTIKLISGIRFPLGKPILKQQKYITVIGRPIKVQKLKKGEYNNYDINMLQTKYIENLKEIFNKYKNLDQTCIDKELNIIE